MSLIRDLHHQAVDLAGQALTARLNGDAQLAKNLARQALDFETRAANVLAIEYDSEPTRSVLYRSAASLAVQCEEYREAERLVAMGLAGNPPTELVDEL